MKIAVIGSGLAAVGAIRALLERGHRPYVLDIGHQLPPELAVHRSRMARSEPVEWSSEDWSMLGRNEGLSGRVVPRKLVFGSDYFYSREQADRFTPKSFVSGSPPWSPARGGFSVGWGAAVLPPAPTDLLGWPLTHEELLRYMQAVLRGVPVSEPDDEIGALFGRLRPNGSHVLALSSGQQMLLRRLKRMSRSDETATILIGQSRLVTQAALDSPSRCRFCGHCSSGCVFESIYTAETDIDSWIGTGRIDYRDKATVFLVEESTSGVRIHFVRGGETEFIEADRLYLAAGAVNSTRILMNSAPFEVGQAIIQRTGGALQLFASVRPLDLSWPEVNTQTSHFAEIQCDALSPYWSHVQIGQPNELILRRLGITHDNSERSAARFGRVAVRHVVSASLNTHSSLGPVYEMRIRRRSDGLPEVETRANWSADRRSAVAKYSRLLARSMMRAGFVPIPLTRQDSASTHGYHFGASFPMRRTPRASFDTDELGRPFGWRRVHIVDTSVLPAIPGTTIGVLTMANAYRIALESAEISP